MLLYMCYQRHRSSPKRKSPPPPYDTIVVGNSIYWNNLSKKKLHLLIFVQIGFYKTQFLRFFFLPKPEKFLDLDFAHTQLNENSQHSNTSYYEVRYLRIFVYQQPLALYLSLIIQFQSFFIQSSVNDDSTSQSCNILYKILQNLCIVTVLHLEINVACFIIQFLVTNNFSVISFNKNNKIKLNNILYMCMHD